MIDARSHQPVRLSEEAHGPGVFVCSQKDGRWPCLTRRLADRVEELETKLGRLVAHRDAVHLSTAHTVGCRCSGVLDYPATQPYKTCATFEEAWDAARQALAGEREAGR